MKTISYQQPAFSCKGHGPELQNKEDPQQRLSKLHKRGQFLFKVSETLVVSTGGKQTFSLDVRNFVENLLFIATKTRGFIIKCIVNGQLVNFSIIF